MVEDLFSNSKHPTEGLAALCHELAHVKENLAMILPNQNLQKVLRIKI